MQKLVFGIIFLVGLSLYSAFSECNKQGFHGPTRGSKGSVYIYYRNDGNGIVTYLFENRNRFPVDVAFAVGGLRDGRQWRIADPYGGAARLSRRRHSCARGQPVTNPQ
jgi:hypothetical protein